MDKPNVCSKSTLVKLLWQRKTDPTQKNGSDESPYFDVSDEIPPLGFISEKSTPTIGRRYQNRLVKQTKLSSISQSSIDERRKMFWICGSIPRLTLRLPSFDKDTDIVQFGKVQLDDRDKVENFCDEKSTGCKSLEACLSSTAAQVALNRNDDDPLNSTSSNTGKGWKATQRFLWKLKHRHFIPSTRSSSTDFNWRLLDSFTWRSLGGTEIQLRGTRFELLSEIELKILQKLAISHLGKILPGLNVSKPKKSFGQVFGISLSKCLENDLRFLDVGLQQHRCRSLDERDASYLSVPGSSLTHRLSDSSISSDKSTCSEPVSKINSNYCSTPEIDAQICDCIDEEVFFSPEIAISPNIQSDDKSANKFSLSNSLQHRKSFEPHLFQVPRIVSMCIDYLQKYGLNTTGLFRVAGSAKRCRQIRMKFDSGQEIVLSVGEQIGEYQPHDICTILKEYFRDLPDVLLVQEFYPAYIAAAKLPRNERINCIRLLFSLLSPVNTDTILVLMRFLQRVDGRARDQYDDNGQVISVGNKMNSRNLATIFAPSILRPDHSKLQATLDENDAQISVVETMIEAVDEIFTIPKELQCQIYNEMREIEPDELDKLLYQLSRCTMCKVLRLY